MGVDLPEVVDGMSSSPQEPIIHLIWWKTLGWLVVTIIIC